MDTHFVHPEWLAPLVGGWMAAALVVGIARTRLRRRRRRLGDHTRPSVSFMRDAALVAALGAIGLALAGPRIGETTLRVPGTGADVVLLFDVSRSMTARDVAPNRLAAAQASASEILARLTPLDRAALAVFASRGVLLVPLTPDFEALGELVAALDTKLVAPAGSDLADGVSAALRAFESGSDRSRVLLVLSDGEDPERRGTLGVAAAVRAGVKVVTAGFGSDAGAYLPDAGDALRNAEGARVVSRRDLRRLARLAEATGGAAFAADASGVFDTQAAVRAIRAQAAQVEGAWVERRVPALQVEPLAALAIALLVLESFVRRRPPSLAAPLALAAIAGLLVAAAPGDEKNALAQIEAELREDPTDPARLIALGVARIERGEHLAGVRALEAATRSSSDLDLTALAWYDLGVAALELGDLERARDAFFDALALAPHDREARFNLEWTLDALRSQTPATEAPPEPEIPAAAIPPPREASLEMLEPDLREAPAPIDAAQQRRLLLSVKDDLRRALRSAAQADAPRKQRKRPAW